mmetsp:Transcript_67426/g.191132  ORF Transcript_67426/g.191132 Transcript_67426/m.191132 type:complete len:347 (+) Transcript_67426:354-1394(+)
MARCAAKVQQPARGQHDDTMAVRELEPVHLRFDVVNSDALARLEPSHVDFIVEMPDVPHNRIILHLLHVLQGDDVLVSCCGDEDVNLLDDRLQLHHLEALHGGLEGADRVDLRDQHAGAGAAQREGAALAHVAVAADHGALAADHDVRGAHEAIRQGVPAAVHIVELRLCHAVVDVDGWEEQLAFFCHVLQTSHACCRLLADTLEVCGHLGPLLWVDLQGVTNDRQDALHLRIGLALGVGLRAVLLKRILGGLALMDENGSIPAIVHEKIGTVGPVPGEGLLCAPPVFLQCLAFPSKDCRRLCLLHGSSSLVLRAENVAGSPPDCSSHGGQRLNKDGRLDGHVEGA